MMSVRNLVAAVLTLAAAGCAQPVESRIADQLSQAGVPPAMAQCMAGIWAQRLSVAQLARLAQAASEVSQAQQQGEALGPMLARVRAFEDPQMIEVVTLSAATCVTQI